jgi:hypothetical protein
LSFHRVIDDFMERRSGYQRLPVLHHPRADALARRCTYDFR